MPVYDDSEDPGNEKVGGYGCVCCHDEGCRCCRDLYKRMQLGVTEEALQEARERRRAELPPAVADPYTEQKLSLWRRIALAVFGRKVERD